MSDTLKDKVAIVSGGSKGYGAGIAAVLQQSGARVWITGRDAGALDAAASRLGVQTVQADVTRPADWDRVFDTVMQTAGHLDILVNNAGGGGKIAPLDQQSDESIAGTIALNLTGQLYGCRRAAAVMKRQRGGLIINISSVCARYAWPGWGPYSAAKAGLYQFSHCLYTELREHGIRVTTITPSWGATEFVAASDITGHPAGQPETRSRCMQPHEMGELVASVCRMPGHLVVPDLYVQPLVQDITPM